MSKTFVRPARVGNWVPTTTWLNQQPITDANKAAYCDGILFREVGINRYEKCVLPGNLVDMDRYLNSDGQTDNSTAWEKFMDYIGQPDLNNPFWLTLVFSSGIYSFSRDLIISGKKVHLTGPGGELVFGAKAGIIVQSRYANDVNLRHLRVSARARDNEDGRVRAQAGPLGEFIGRNLVPSGARNLANQTIGDILTLPEHANTYVYSPDPDVYNDWGLLATGTLRMNHCVFTGFAAGIYLNGKAIGDKTNPNAPDGYNTSLSILDDIIVRQVNGPGIVTAGADGNHVRVNNPDCRDTSCVGFLDLSQSGAMVMGGHFAVNYWGDFWMLSNGDSRMECTYSEVNDKSCCVVNGRCTVTGGPLNSNILVTSDGALVQRGSSFSNLTANLALDAYINFKGVDRYQNFTLSRSDDYKAWVMNQGGSPSNGGVWAFHSEGATVGGRTFAITGTSTRGIYIGGKLFVTAQTLDQALSNYRTVWEPGDEVHISPWGCNTPPLYRCVSAGRSANLPYSAIENLTVQNRPNSTQGLIMNGVSKYVRPGLPILINGQLFGILNSSTTSDGLYTTVDLSYPGIDLQGQVGTVDILVALFAAGGQGTGTTTQRPPSLTEYDDGWPYKDVTLGKMIQWDGPSMSWRDFLGNPV